MSVFEDMMSFSEDTDNSEGSNEYDFDTKDLIHYENVPNPSISESALSYIPELDDDSYHDEDMNGPQTKRCRCKKCMILKKTSHESSEHNAMPNLTVTYCFANINNMQSFPSEDLREELDDRKMIKRRRMHAYDCDRNIDNYEDQPFMVVPFYAVIPNPVPVPVSVPVPFLVTGSITLFEHTHIS